MIKTTFYTTRQQILYNRAVLVDEITLKKNKPTQKYPMYDVGRQLIMP
jgi:hypothetical protein